MRPETATTADLIRLAEQLGDSESDDDDEMTFAAENEPQQPP